MSTVPSRARLLAVALAAVGLAGCGSQAHTEKQVAAAPKKTVEAAPPATHVSRPRHHTTHRRAHPFKAHRVVATKPATPAKHHSPKPHIPHDAASNVATNGCMARTANMQRAIGMKLMPSDPAQAPALLARLQTLDIGGRSPLMAQAPKRKIVQAALDRAIAATRQWAGVLVIGADGRREAEQRGEQVIAAVAAINAAARVAGLGDCVVPIS